MNVVKASVGKERGVRVRSFESRTATRVGRLAISTQALPSPLPEKEDFCQLTGVVKVRLTVPSSVCG